MKRPKGLGRGLDVLLGGDRDDRVGAGRDETGADSARGDEPAAPGARRARAHGGERGDSTAADASASGATPAPGVQAASAAPVASGVSSLPLERLEPGRYQPRTRMDEAALQELADSIRQHGLMQPIVVRPVGPQRYEIVAGERRFRAARLAGLPEVPVLVRAVPDEQALQLALIENIQREDLNPLEEAQAVRRLVDEFGYTHERAAQALGRSRSATTNLLRLLNLAGPVQTMLLAGDLEMGHARALLALGAAGQIALAQHVVDRRLSVRETEAIASRGGLPAVAPRRGAASEDDAAGGDADVRRLQRRLSDRLATRVEIRQGARGRGALVIHFDGNEAFESLLGRLRLADADRD